MWLTKDRHWGVSGRRTSVVASIVLSVFAVGIWMGIAGAATTPTYKPQQVVVALKKKSGTMTVATLAQKLKLKLIKSMPTLKAGVLQLPPKTNPKTFAVMLKRIAEVRLAEPNYLYYPMVLEAPDDPAYNEIDDYYAWDPDLATWYQWDLHLIDALGGWSIWPNQYYTSEIKPLDTIKVGVIDTGIDRTHADFINAGGSSTDALLGGQLDIANSANLVSGYSGPYPSFDDEYGHGTHVAGTIAAATNNGQSFDEPGGGMAGLGYNSQILTLKIFGAFGGASDYDIATAIAYGADKGAKVLNLSLGGPGYSQLTQDAINYAWTNGTICAISMGNDAQGTYPNYPAACDRVLAVSSTSIDDALASYSSFGNWVGIAAPGGDTSTGPYYLGTWSTLPTYPVTLNLYGYNLNYDYLEGTSMAAPHVAGLAALYAGYRYDATGSYATPLEVFQAIQRGADNIAGTAKGGWSRYVGYGRINVYNTMAQLNARDATVGGITGQVTSGGTPAPYINVIAVATSGIGRYTTTSRVEDGCYRLANLPEGTYNLTASSGGRSASLSNVTVTAGCDTPGIDLAVPAAPAGSLSGTITDSTYGFTIPAQIWVRKSSPSNSPWLAKIDNDPWTGAYSVTGLSTGNYVIYATSYLYRAQQFSAVAVTVDQTTWKNVALRSY